MSNNVNVDGTPNHFMVLDAISQGIGNVEEITRATKLRKDEVELIINDLLTQRLIVKSEKKSFIFARKKAHMAITEIGVKLLNSKKQELEQKRLAMRKSYDNGDGTQLQSYIDSNRMWIPLMLFSGIMDMMFFTSMMSFMGLGMNSMESAITGTDTTNDQDSSNKVDTQPEDHQSEKSGQENDSQNDGDGGSSSGGDDVAYNSDYGNSDFDSGVGGGSFDGFGDGGGFDSF